ncbi:MAG TPA: sigma-70 family RNA polymerase sigma factor [Myxococcaceae bacterium]|jgi:RNA polymerase sigma-70 factor (ECF subfamily)
MLQAAPGPVAERSAGDSAIADALEQKLTAARKQWPAEWLDDDAFAAYLGQRLPPDGDPLAALRELRAEDLYLAAAAGRSCPQAMAELEQQYFSRLDDTLRRLDPSPTFISEVKQLLRQKLFLDQEGMHKKIGEFSGRGPLLSWLRAAATRIGLTLHRRDERQVSLEAAGAEELELPGDDPELDYLKAHYRTEFKAAFRAAMDQLSDHELSVLRLHLLDGLNIEKIGGIYGTHRSTVARWIAKSREKLLEETRRALAARLQVGPDELESVMGLLGSRLDVSIYRYLKQR